MVSLPLFWPLSRLSSAALTMTYLRVPAVHEIKCRPLSTAPEVPDLVSARSPTSSPAAPHLPRSKLPPCGTLNETVEMHVRFASVQFCVLVLVF